MTRKEYEDFCKDIGETPESVHKFAVAIAHWPKTWEDDYQVFTNAYNYSLLEGSGYPKLATLKDEKVC